MNACLRSAVLMLLLSLSTHDQAAYATLDSPVASPVFVSIDFPGASATRGYGINGQGQVVGSYDDSAGLTHGFFMSSQGAFRSMDPLQSEWTESYGINRAGVIVGTFLQGFQHGFRFREGRYQVFDFVGEINSALGINGSGDIVGFYADVCCNLRGYLFHQNKFTEIDYPGALRTVPAAINDLGTIVGIWRDSANVNHGFVFESGTFTNLDVPGAIATFADGINSAKTITGTYLDSSGISHGFLYSNGRFRTVDFPGAASTDISGINDVGMIVGDYTDANGAQHGFFGHR
jgi:uncharacterized membrane protein